MTHDQEEALRLSDRIAVFDTGRIEQVGTGPELYANPATHFVADFIGDSSFLDGRIVGLDGGLADLRFAAGTLVRGVPLHAKGQPGQPAELMLRPERVELSPEPGPEGASLPVAVQDVTFLGNTTDVAAVTAWNTPVAVRLGFRHPLAGRVARGDRLWIYWTPEAAQAFPRG